MSNKLEKSIWFEKINEIIIILYIIKTYSYEQKTRDAFTLNYPNTTEYILKIRIFII